MIEIKLKNVPLYQLLGHNKNVKDPQATNRRTQKVTNECGFQR